MTKTTDQQNGTSTNLQPLQTKSSAAANSKNSSQPASKDTDDDMGPPDVDIDVLDASDSEPSSSPKKTDVDFDGGLMSEEPDFDEDFAPDEAEIAVASASKVDTDSKQAAESRTKRPAAVDTDEMLESPQKHPHPSESNKRVKLDHTESSEQADNPAAKGSAVDKMPMELWTEIFAYLTPETLGKLRKVCRNFYKALINENVWRRSRKIHAGDMPKPVFGLREWQMWELWKGAGCMLCDRYDGLPKGSGGVRIYWPFRVRSCPECLQENTTKEMVLLKANPLPISEEEIRLLLPALPYGILDAGQNWNGNPNSYQPNTGMSKIYWNDDILELKERYDEAKEMNASEEWLKGLESEGQSYKADADRMDRWETRVLTGSNQPRKGASVPQPILSLGNSYNHNSWDPHHQSPRHPPPPHQQPFPHHPNFYTNSSRHERTASEVAEIKAQRQNDIELRCLQINPPIHANVLIHCPAFQAAIKIAQPLNEQAWQLLLPKLKEQRPAAEKAAKQHQEQQERLQRQQEERRLLEVKEKDEWVRKERIWEESQVPVREMLGKIVDAEVKAWEGKIDKQTAPRFAVTVLTKSRENYYKQGGIPETKTDKAKAEDGSSGDKSEIRKLVLENMKWVFDTKIKPLTDPLRKDLFLCRGCGDAIPKLYGFEGVIQHYAAKHTTDMSLGNVVVFWRSEWPEEPPFTDPTAAKKPQSHPSHSFPANGARGSQGQPFHPRGAPPLHPQQPPVQGYGNQQYPNQQRIPPHGHYDYQNGSQQHYPPPHNVHMPPHGREPHLRHQAGPMHAPPQAAPPQNMPGPYYGNQAYPPPQPEYNHQYPPTTQAAYPPYPNTYTAAPSQPPYYAPSHAPPPMQPYDSYGQPQAIYPPDQSQAAHQQPPPGPPVPAAVPPAQPIPANQVPVSRPFNNRNNNNSSKPVAPPPAPIISKPSEPEPAKKDDARHAEMLDFVSTTSTAEWHIAADIRDLQNSVKVTVMIAKVSEAFKAKFNSILTVQLYHEALREKENMKFLRNVSDLNCGACAGAMAANRKHTLPLLLQHFESVHYLFTPAKQQKQLDWLVDMIKLPDLEELRKLRERQGFDAEKLSVISKRFPGVFDTPKPAEQSATANGSSGSKKPPSKKETLVINTQVSTPESNGSTVTLKSGVPEPPGSAPKTASKESMTAAEQFLRDFMVDSDEGKVPDSRAGSQSNRAPTQAGSSGKAAASSSSSSSQERRPGDPSSKSKGASQEKPSLSSSSYHPAGGASSHRHGASLDMDSISSRREPPSEVRRTGSLDESRRFPPRRDRSASPRREPLPPSSRASRDEYSRRSTPSRATFPGGPPGRDDDHYPPRRYYDTPPRRVRSPSPVGSGGRYDDRMPPGGPVPYRDYPPEHYPPSHYEYGRDPYYERYYDRDIPLYRDDPYDYYNRRDGPPPPHHPPPPPPPPPRGYYDDMHYNRGGGGHFRDRSPLREPGYGRRPPSPPPPRRRNPRSVSPPYRGGGNGGRDPYYERDPPYRYPGGPPQAQGSIDEYRGGGGPMPPRRDERYYPPRGW